MNLEFNAITFLNNESVKNSEKPFISVSKLILPRAGVLRHWGASSGWVMEETLREVTLKGLCRIIQNTAPWTNSTQQLLLW